MIEHRSPQENSDQYVLRLLGTARDLDHRQRAATEAYRIMEEHKAANTPGATLPDALLRAIATEALRRTR